MEALEHFVNELEAEPWISLVDAYLKHEAELQTYQDYIIDLQSIINQQEAVLEIIKDDVERLKVANDY